MPLRRTPTRKTPEETRAALLAAAAEAFAVHGYEGARVDQIAARAAVNKAMISYHFGGKAGLYAATVTATFDALRDRLAAIPPGRPPAERLRGFVEAFAEVAALRSHFPAVLLREVLSGGRRIDDAILPHILALFQAVREIIEDGTRDGSFRKVDPLLTHLGLIGALIFFFATRPFRERLIAERRIPVEIPEPDAFVRHLEEMLTRGLASGPAA